MNSSIEHTLFQHLDEISRETGCLADVAHVIWPSIQNEKDPAVNATYYLATRLEALQGEIEALSAEVRPRVTPSE